MVVFAREPVAGRVKTRLAADIGDSAAARIYQVLFERTLTVVTASPFDPVVSLAESATRSWLDHLDVRWEIQRGVDLGSRMHDAFDRRFREGYDRAIIVGSDCPGFQGDHLCVAFDALDRVPVVLGPASDGGYWMVAQRRPGVDHFSGIPWSTPRTLAMTRKRLDTLAAPWFELDELDDVDTEEDLRNALSDPRVAPEVRRRLEDAAHS